MNQQEWWCEVCGASGCVEYQRGADLATVTYAIDADHKERSPSCAAHFSQLRIRNRLADGGK